MTSHSIKIRRACTESVEDTPGVMRIFIAWNGQERFLLVWDIQIREFRFLLRASL
jgi:hypothetical protein